MRSPNPANGAIVILREAMNEFNLNQESLACLLGRAQPVISGIFTGKRAISPELAVELESAFRGKFTAEKLLALQAEHFVANIRRSGKNQEILLKTRLGEEFPILEMEKRGWIPKGSTLQEKVSNALKFARCSSDLDQIVPPFQSMALARQSPNLGYLSPTSRNSRTWQYRVRELAGITPAKEYCAERFETECLPKLRKLVRTMKGVAEVPQILAQFGVRLVFVAHLEKTKLDGAAVWLDVEKTQPVIALTLRFGTLDTVWFNLAHEIIHIVKRHEISVDLEGDDEKPDDLRVIEEEANAGAAEWLIPQSRFRAFVERRMGKFSRESILAFAEIVDVHPAVLVGMLQFKGIIPRSVLNDLKPQVRKYILLAAISDGFDDT